MMSAMKRGGMSVCATSANDKIAPMSPGQRDDATLIFASGCMAVATLRVFIGASLAMA